MGPRTARNPLNDQSIPTLLYALGSPFRVQRNPVALPITLHSDSDSDSDR
jgi:hypothetical protein